MTLAPPKRGAPGRTVHIYVGPTTITRHKRLTPEMRADSLRRRVLNYARMKLDAAKIGYYLDKWYAWLYGSVTQNEIMQILKQEGSKMAVSKKQEAEVKPVAKRVKKGAAETEPAKAVDKPEAKPVAKPRKEKKIVGLTSVKPAAKKMGKTVAKMIGSAPKTMRKSASGGRMLLGERFGSVVRALGIAKYSTDDVMAMLKREKITSTRASISCFMSEGRSGRKPAAKVSAAKLKSLMQK